jgi:hypothetical protein
MNQESPKVFALGKLVLDGEQMRGANAECRMLSAEWQSREIEVFSAAKPPCPLTSDP